MSSLAGAISFAPLCEIAVRVTRYPEAMNRLVGILLVAFVIIGSVSHAQETLIGDWLHVPNVDLITDEDRSLIAARATTFPSYADAASIVVRCSDSGRYGVDLFFVADKYLGSDSSFDVVYRVDGGEAKRGRWGASTTKEAAFAPDLGVSGMVSALLGGSELVFRISAYSQDYTYVVPVSGLRAALGKLGCYTGAL